MSRSIKLQDNNYWDTKSIVHNKNLLSNIIGNHIKINTSNTLGNINKWTKIFSATSTGTYTGKIIIMDIYLVGETVGYMKLYVRLKTGYTPIIKVLSMSPYSENMKDWYIYYDNVRKNFELWRINPSGTFNFCVIEAVGYGEGDVTSSNPLTYFPITWYNNFGFNSTPSLANNVQLTIPTT